MKGFINFRVLYVLISFMLVLGEPDTDSSTLFIGYYILTYTNLLISLKIYKNGRKRNYQD